MCVTDICTNTYFKISLNLGDTYSKSILDFITPGISNIPGGYPYLFITTQGRKVKKTYIKKYKEKYVEYFI